MLAFRITRSYNAVSRSTSFSTPFARNTSRLFMASIRLSFIARSYSAPALLTSFSTFSPLSARQCARQTAHARFSPAIRGSYTVTIEFTFRTFPTPYARNTPRLYMAPTRPPSVIDVCIVPPLNLCHFHPSRSLQESGAQI